MEYVCQYCGKKMSHPNEYNAKKKLNIHLKYCRVRKAGIDFNVGEQKVNVKPKSVRCVNDLRQTLKDIEQLPSDIQGAIVTGVLITEQKYKKVKDFNFY